MHGVNSKTLQNSIQLFIVCNFSLYFIFLVVNFTHFVLDLQEATCRSTGLAGSQCFLQLFSLFIERCILLLQILKVSEAFIQITILAEILFIALWKFANRLLNTPATSCLPQLLEVLLALLDLFLQIVHLHSCFLGFGWVFSELFVFSVGCAGDVDIGEVKICVNSSAFSDGSRG